MGSLTVCALLGWAARRGLPDEFHRTHRQVAFESVESAVSLIGATSLSKKSKRADALTKASGGSRVRLVCDTHRTSFVPVQASATSIIQS
jgi:hypothetical protein